MRPCCLLLIHSLSQCGACTAVSLKSKIYSYEHHNLCMATVHVKPQFMPRRGKSKVSSLVSLRKSFPLMHLRRYTLQVQGQWYSTADIPCAFHCMYAASLRLWSLAIPGCAIRSVALRNAKVAHVMAGLWHC